MVTSSSRLRAPREGGICFFRCAAAALGLAVSATGCVQQRPLQTSGPIDLVFAATTDLHGYVRGWDVSTRRGVKIAMVGATTPGSMLWDRDNLAGRLVVRDIVPEVRSAVQEARNAAADIVVVILHSGLNEPSSYDTVTTGVASENVAARVAREVPGIDLIVYGHSH